MTSWNSGRIVATQAVRSLLREVLHDYSVQHPFHVRSRRSPSFRRNSYRDLGVAQRSYGMKIAKTHDPLECPYCGGENLHQKNCTTYWRNTEDSNFGISTFSADEQALFSANMNGNPSSRRDGISISFWCESCGDISQLDIIQHKGSTFIAWSDEK